MMYDRDEFEKAMDLMEQTVANAIAYARDRDWKRAQRDVEHARRIAGWWQDEGGIRYQLLMGLAVAAADEVLALVDAHA